MQRRIALVLGKKPRRGTIIDLVLGLLDRAGVGCTVLLPHEQDVCPSDTDGVDLVVHRGLAARDEDLLAALAATGTPVCNPLEGIVRLRDRAALHAAVEQTGVPAPSGAVRHTWAEVLAEEQRRPVVVKAVTGPGRGQAVLPSPLPDEAPMEGPYLVEELVEHDGTDRKLYVAGDRVSGLLKPSTLTSEHTTDGEPFEVGTALADLARATTSRLGLHLAGVDVVLGPDGPVVVDVNPFPGYRGVDGAGEAVAAHLLEHLGAAATTP